MGPHGTEVVLMEKARQAGGIWGLPSDISPIYEHLKTNAPRPLMCYPDFPFDEAVKVSMIHCCCCLNFI